MTLEPFGRLTSSGPYSPTNDKPPVDDNVPSACFWGVIFCTALTAKPTGEKLNAIFAYLIIFSKIGFIFCHKSLNQHFRLKYFEQFSVYPQ